MANQALQASAGLAILVTSDDYDIPFHSVAAQGTSSAGAFFNLKADGMDFVALGVKQGMTIWNLDTAQAAIVIRVGIDDLGLTESIFLTGGERYQVFSEKNPGCLIWAGNRDPGSITVTTQGGDKVTFRNLSKGMMLPVRIARIWTTDTDITESLVALW
jgi:hypothetical protein